MLGIFDRDIFNSLYPKSTWILKFTPAAFGGSQVQQNRLAGASLNANVIPGLVTQIQLLGLAQNPNTFLPTQASVMT